MKRVCILGKLAGFVKCAGGVIILASFVAVCFAQQKPRSSTLKIIQLPEAKLTGSMSLEEALAKQPRYTAARPFSGQGLKPTQIGQLAWAALGIGDWGPAIQLYLATQDGVYLYSPDTHSLQQTLNLDVRGGLAAATVNPEAVASAGCCLVLTSFLRDIGIRSTGKARQLILLQAGHIAQNIQLQAVSMALGSAAIGDFDPRNARSACNLPRSTEPLYIVAVGYMAEQTPTGPGQDLTTATPPQQIPSRPRKAIFIIPAENFQDEELFDTRRFLDITGVLTVVASTRIGTIRGMLGNAVEATVAITDLRVDDYDAIIFVGGLGAKLYFNSPVALNIAREAAAKRKVLAAISVAPTILANAGVLRGVRATSFISERLTLERAGARYTGVPVERDGLIITATGPITANGFARAIADALAGR